MVDGSLVTDKKKAKAQQITSFTNSTKIKLHSPYVTKILKIY